MFFAEKKCVAFKMLMVPKYHITGFQLPDKIGICSFFDHFDPFAYQTHR